MYNVAFLAPMISQDSLLNKSLYANSKPIKLLGLPKGNTSFTMVFTWHNGTPINGLKWYFVHASVFNSNVKLNIKKNKFI
jgi:hypothetical protein